MQVLLAPQISEKATFIADKNEQVIFIVAPDATKPEIKAAVELALQGASRVCSGLQRQGQGKALRPLCRPSQ
jgi:large subunit ribosomal protein L23